MNAQLPMRAGRGTGQKHRPMNAFKYSFTPFILIALFGCTAARPRPLAQPEAMIAQGTFTHEASGMTFPLHVGDFERSTVLRKDTQGRHVSARYDLISMAVSVAVTVDIYPAPPLDTVGLPSEMVAVARENLSQQEFESRRRGIMSSHSGAVLVQEGELSLPQSVHPHPGKLAVFEYEDTFSRQRQPVRSQLYVFCFAGGDWVINYQFTYPRNADALQEVETFMTNLPWTLKRAAPMGSR